MRERVYNSVWGLGVRTRNLAKRLGLLGSLEPVLAYLGPRIMPPPSEEVEVSLPFGMRMIVPPAMPSFRNFATGLYEKNVTDLLPDIIKHGMTVVDLGANVGYYTLLASRLVGPAGQVYSFEPDPDIYSYLQRNIAVNGSRNVVSVVRAIADRVHSATFIRQELERGFLSPSDTTATSIVVETTTLDTFFAQQGWPSIDLIKMDIEGGEQAALRGMKELSQRNPGLQLIMEFNLSALQRAGATPESLALNLQELGFCSGYVIEQGMKPFSVAREFPRSHAIYNLLLRQGGN